MGIGYLDLISTCNSNSTRQHFNGMLEDWFKMMYWNSLVARTDSHAWFENSCYIILFYFHCL